MSISDDYETTDANNRWQFQINGDSYTENIERVEIDEKINQPLRWNAVLVGAETDDSNFSSGNTVELSLGGTRLFKGRLIDVNPASRDARVELRGQGMAYDLSRRRYPDSANSPKVWDGADVSTVISDIVTSNPVNTVNTVDATNNGSSFGTVDFRMDEESKISGLTRLAGDFNAEWWIDDNDNFNFASEKSTGSVVATFNDTNTRNIEKNDNGEKGDYDGVVVKGYGDGEDQIRATAGNTSVGSEVLVYVDKTITSESQAQERANSMNNSRSGAWTEIEVELADSYQVRDIGDVVSVKSDDGDIPNSTDYRVVERSYSVDFRSGVSARLVCNNRPDNVFSRMQDQEHLTKSETQYMQGSRNVWGHNESENCTNPNPLEIDFYLPPDVENIMSENRTNKVKLDYSASGFRSSAAADPDSTVTVTESVTNDEAVADNLNDFDDSVAIEASNINSHNHPVGSATTTGANEPVISDTLEFDGTGMSDPNVASSGWTKIIDRATGSSILELTQVEDDLAHEGRLDITTMQDSGGSTVTRDLQFALVRDDGSPSAFFGFFPTNPAVGQKVQFESTSKPGPILSYHWDFGDGNTALGESPEHFYNSSGDFTVELRIYKEGGLTSKVIESDRTNKQFIVDGDITSNLIVGEKIKIFQSDGIDGAYTIAGSTYDSGADQTTITVEEPVKYNYTNLDDTGFVEYFPDSGMQYLDSTTNQITVSSTSTLSVEEVATVQGKDVEDVEAEDWYDIDAEDLDKLDEERVDEISDSLDSELLANYANFKEGNVDNDIIRKSDRSVLDKDIRSQDVADSLTIDEPQDNDTFTAPADIQFEIDLTAGSSESGVVGDDNDEITAYDDSISSQNELQTFKYAGWEDTIRQGSTITYDWYGAEEYDTGNTTSVTIEVRDVASDSSSAEVTIDGTDYTVFEGDNVVDPKGDSAFLQCSSISYLENVSGDPSDNTVTFKIRYVGLTFTVDDVPAGERDIIIQFDDGNAITVNDSVVVDVNTSNQAPSAQFSYSPSNPEIFDSVSFTDESTDPDGDSTINKWEWDFGDGTTETITSSPADTSHSYDSAGTYTVELTVTDDEGATSTTTNDVDVGDVETLNDTIKMFSSENVGGSPTSINTSDLSTQSSSMADPNTVFMASSNNVGALNSPPTTDNFYLVERFPIPREAMSDKYELYIATQGSNSIYSIAGEFTIIRHNHRHDIPRQDDFAGEDVLVGSGAENKEVLLEKTDQTNFKSSSIAGSEKSKLAQNLDATSTTDGSGNDPLYDISSDLVQGVTANNIEQIKIDGTDRTDELFGTGNTGPTQESELDITEWLDDNDSDGVPDVGWHTVTLVPDQATYLKSRLVIDHHKDADDS